MEEEETPTIQFDLIEMYRISEALSNYRSQLEYGKGERNEQLKTQVSSVYSRLERFCDNKTARFGRPMFILTCKQEDKIRAESVNMLTEKGE